MRPFAQEGGCLFVVQCAPPWTAVEPPERLLDAAALSVADGCRPLSCCLGPQTEGTHTAFEVYMCASKQDKPYVSQGTVGTTQFDLVATLSRRRFDAYSSGVVFGCPCTIIPEPVFSKVLYGALAMSGMIGMIHLLNRSLRPSTQQRKVNKVPVRCHPMRLQVRMVVVDPDASVTFCLQAVTLCK